MTKKLERPPFKEAHKLRAEAKAAGAKFYFTGKPCKNGHTAFRHICGSCTQCGVEYAENNRKRVAKRNREWQKNNPKKCALYRARTKEKIDENFRIRTRERGRVWYQKNLERERAKRRELSKNNRGWYRKYYAKNVKQILLQRKALRLADPEKYRLLDRRMKAIRKAAEGYFTQDDVDNLFTKQKCKCVYCKKSVKNNYHLDHIVPLARGGTSWPVNIQILCPTCNRRKRDKDPIEFAKEIRRAAQC